MKISCVVVIGLGSMGKRRIRLLQKYNHSLKIIGIDTNIERQEKVQKEYKIEIEDSIESAIKEYAPSCAFVCTAPLSHAQIILKCQKCGLHVFTELNLVSDGYEKIISMADEKQLKVFMSSTLQYRDEIKYIKDCVRNLRESVNYVYHVGQYLPDWHPWENYKDFFVGERRTNGCREIFAIDLPWIVSTFGKVTNIMVQIYPNS